MLAVKDFYLLRTPLLPVNFLEQFTQLPYKELAEKIKSTFQDPYLIEAIYIASPELYQELMKGPLTEKMVMSLFKYLLRMCSRCTPYGLFAGSATGTFAAASDIRLADHHTHRKHCRLDMNYVAELVQTVSQQPDIQSQLTFYPNNSLYRIADTYRYAAYSIKNKFRHYTLTSVNHTPYLEKILATAATGASIETLCYCIVSDDISYEEALEFVNELVDSQLLVSDLEPTVTGEEFFSVLTRKLNLPFFNKISELLQQPGTYLQTHELVKKLLPDTKNKDLVQTDLFLNTINNTISLSVVEQIAQQLIPLWKLSRMNSNPDLQQFCQRFRERYEEQEVPLALVLDTESGIGYTDHTGGYAAHTPLIDNIYTEQKEDKTITWNKMQEFQYQRLLSGTREIVLTDEDLDNLKTTDAPPIPDSLFMMGSILADSAAAVDAGDYLFELNSCGGPSAANLLGRFCHGDALLSAKVKACLEEEEAVNPDCIYAEIIHLPEARTGNILARPQLRDYEIVYLGTGSVDATHQIPISDLMVSVVNNKVILRSIKLNKRVIPRLSTAHNFNNASLPVYKFLCDLQFQQLHHAAGWQWNLPVEASFFPRVRYGNIIISKSRWILNKGQDIAELDLPRYVTIAEGDNELFIDLESESCMKLLTSTLAKKDRVVIQELLSTPSKCWVTANNGRFTHELIIPLKSTHPKKDMIASTAHNRMPIRHFIPGSEWLYVKIYCGTNTAEKVLKSVILPLTADTRIDKWFFIRYVDPDHHIRVRFHTAHWKDILEKLYSALKEFSGRELIHKVQTDTYSRELERYGADNIELSETVFYYDSEAILKCINLLEGDDSETYRWLLAARGVDMLLHDFGFELSRKAALLKRIQHHFFEEFGGGQALQTQLNDQYRQHMRQLSSFLDEQQDVANGIEEATELFKTRSEHLAAITLAPLTEAISSYIHMFLNRMLLSNQRKHELVIYHFLSKYYDSQIAISNRKAVAKSNS